MWSLWGECSTTCGYGLRNRYRPCIGGQPGDDGCEWVDGDNDYEYCKIKDCEGRKVCNPSKKPTYDDAYCFPGDQC